MDGGRVLEKGTVGLANTKEKGEHGLSQNNVRGGETTLLNPSPVKEFEGEIKGRA